MEELKVNHETPELSTFIEKVNALRLKHSDYYQSRPIKIDGKGKRYIRLSEYENDKPSCAFCFVCTQTGNVLKPKSYKAPILINPRGNIFDSDNGLSGVTIYGTTYLW